MMAVSNSIRLLAKKSKRGSTSNRRFTHNPRIVSQTSSLPQTSRLPRAIRLPRASSHLQAGRLPQTSSLLQAGRLMAARCFDISHQGLRASCSKASPSESNVQSIETARLQNWMQNPQGSRIIAMWSPSGVSNGSPTISAPASFSRAQLLEMSSV